MSEGAIATCTTAAAWRVIKTIEDTCVKLLRKHLKRHNKRVHVHVSALLPVMTRHVLSVKQLKGSVHSM